ncbi:MAG: pantetheine-phosphate adenylyltransferase [Planctomycetota bacterium]|jgi:pantetheine-phosphate adenylyltransferase
MSDAKHVALYSGSFDPMTLGHLDVLGRARGIFDEIVVAVGRNPEKEPLFSSAERVDMAERLVAELVATTPGGAPVRVEGYHGLTVDFARQIGANVLLRGLRHGSDLASECQLAIANRQVAEMETVFVVAGEIHGYTSSSLIKQVAALGGDLERLATMVPPIVLEALRARRNQADNPLGRLARNAPEE